MFINREINSKGSLLFLVPFALYLVIFIGQKAATNALNLKSFVLVIVGVVLIGFLFAKRHNYFILLCVGLTTIIFGHRGIYIGYWTFFVPLQLIVWFLCICIISKSIISKTKIGFKIPGLLLFVCFWGVFRILISEQNWFRFWDNIVAWTSPLILAIPTFLVVKQLINKLNQVEFVLRIFLFVTGIISILGLFEYFYAPASQLFPGFFINPKIAAQGGFSRAAFSFWGYPAVASIITWGALIAYNDIVTKQHSRFKWWIIPIFIICVMAVYVSGQRSSWLGLGAGLIILSFPHRSTKKGRWMITIILLVSASFLLPDIFWSRFGTLTKYALTGSLSDTSMISHLVRWQWAIDAIIENPILGVGYGQWKTHNVFLEIGSKIGLIPAFVFIGFVIQLLSRIRIIAIKSQNSDVQRIGFLFIALAVNWIIQMMVEIVVFTPVFAAPYWFVIALGWYLPNICHSINRSRISNYQFQAKQPTLLK